VKRVGVGDLGPVTDFLNRRAEFAMFPLNNLRLYGLDGDKPFSVRMWQQRSGGETTDVLALTTHGMVMPCLPNGDYAAVARVLCGTPVTGIIGPRAQVRGIETALGLGAAPRTLDHDEPHFLLSLEAMKIPDGIGTLCPLGDAPEIVIREWMLDYQLTALNTPADRAPAMVDQSYRAYLERGSHVVLMDAGKPLAMTGFNAQMPDIVQIGGVYTPPELRGRGHARRAVALHLAQAAASGVTRATLFSASDRAARAYRAIGFEQIGDWTLLLFDGAQMPAAAATGTIVT
jgi:RimJ/RimL family protein N-acetyltransferase